MSATYRIRLDRSDRSTLAVCSCGWRSLALSVHQAEQAAITHELNCHIGGRQAYQIAYASARRAKKRQHP